MAAMVALSMIPEQAVVAGGCGLSWQDTSVKPGGTIRLGGGSRSGEACDWVDLGERFTEEGGDLSIEVAKDW